MKYMLNTFVLMCMCPSYLLLHILTPKGGVASDFTFEAKVTFFALSRDAQRGTTCFTKPHHFYLKLIFYKTNIFLNYF